MDETMIDKLYSLAVALNGVIGSGKFDHITFGDIKEAVEIDPFQYMADIQPHHRWALREEEGLDLFSDDEREKLTAEWQALLADRGQFLWKMGLTDTAATGEGEAEIHCKRGLSLMLALVLQSIRKRLPITTD